MTSHPLFLVSDRHCEPVRPLKAVVVVIIVVVVCPVDHFTKKKKYSGRTTTRQGENCSAKTNGCNGKVSGHVPWNREKQRTMK